MVQVEVDEVVELKAELLSLPGCIAVALVKKGSLLRSSVRCH